MKTKTIDIKDVGKVRMVKSLRARSVNISIKPFEGVRVSIPKNISFNQAEKIVHGKLGWIKKHMSKISRLEDSFTIFDEGSQFSTRTRKLVIKPDKRQNSSVVVSGKFINVKYPEDKKVTDNTIQGDIRKGIIRALRKEAKEYLPGRVDKLAKKHGFTFQKVFLKNQKTRWGSCSSKGNINLNIQLMRMPDELVDFVIIHELAHTVEQNHGKKFWSILNGIFGDAKTIDKKLKNYRTQIF